MTQVLHFNVKLLVVVMGSQSSLSYAAPVCQIQKHANKCVLTCVKEFGGTLIMTSLTSLNVTCVLLCHPSNNNANINRMASCLVKKKYCSLNCRELFQLLTLCCGLRFTQFCLTLQYHWVNTKTSSWIYLQQISSF